jgi:hypothetical protein
MVFRWIGTKRDKAGQSFFCPRQKRDGTGHHPIGVSVCPGVPIRIYRWIVK